MQVKQFQAKGNEAFEAGQFSTAIEFYTQAIEASNNTSHILFSNRSAAFFKLGQFENSFKDAVKVLQLRPEWPKGYYRLGQALIGLGKFSDAMNIFKQGLEKDPDSDQMREAFLNARSLMIQDMEKSKTSQQFNAENSPLMQPRFSYASGECISCLKWSRDGTKLAVGNLEGKVTVLRVNRSDSDVSFEAVMDVNAHELGTCALDWNSTDTMLVSAGQDGRAKVWDFDNQEGPKKTPKVAVKGGSSWVEHAIFVPNSDLFITASGKFLRLWSAASGELVRTYTTDGSTIADLTWHHSKHRFAVCSYSHVTIFDVEREEPEHDYKWKGSLIKLIYSPDANWVVCGAQENCIHLWDTRTGQDLQMQGYRRKVKELSMNSTSHWLATGGGAELMIWDFSGSGPAGRMPRFVEAHSDVITDVAFAHDFGGKGVDIVASAGKDGRVFVFNMLNTKFDQALVRAECSANEEEPVSAEKISWSPDNSLLAVGLSNGNLFLFEPPL